MPEDPTPDPQAGPGGGESTFTVIVAAVANLGIALAKAVAGVLSGSSAMLSEAAHSVADTVTEVLLLTALRRSGKPADEEHPLGHGPERYVWALLAAVATFVGGSVFSLYDGIRTLVAGEELGDPLVSYVVLAVAFLLEGYSLRTGVKQARGEAVRFRAPLRRYLRHTPDTAVKAVVMEDSAALIGLVLAAGGLLGGRLHRIGRLRRRRLAADRRPAAVRRLGARPVQRRAADRPPAAGAHAAADPGGTARRGGDRGRTGADDPRPGPARGPGRRQGRLPGRVHGGADRAGLRAGRATDAGGVPGGAARLPGPHSRNGPGYASPASARRYAVIGS
ncbi:Ferrous-iron efflux pump FieF [Streptomyces glaucescens]